MSDLSPFQLPYQMRDGMGQQPFLPPNVSGWPSGGRWLHAGFLMTWCTIANALVGSVRNVPGGIAQQLASASPATAVDTAARLMALPDLLPGTRTALTSFVGGAGWGLDRACGALVLLLMSPDFLAC
jgi:hypothetical protein